MVDDLKTALKSLVNVWVRVCMYVRVHVNVCVCMCVSQRAD